MKVLMVCKNEQGRTLVEELIKQGIETSIFTAEGNYVESKVPITSVKYPNSFYFTWFMHNLRKESAKFDVIHAHHLKGYAFLAALSVPVLKNLVSTAYASDVFGMGFKPKAIFAVSRSDSVILQTESMQKLLGIENYEVIPNGIPKDYAPKMSKQKAKEKLKLKSKKIIVYPKLDSGMKYLLKSIPDMHDIVLALPSIMKDIKSETEVKKVFHSEDDLDIFMRAADICVVPSTRGDRYVDILRAMACGTPVIASASGLLPAIVKENGFLVPIGDTETLKRRITELIEDKKLWKRYSAYGVIHSKDFHLHKLTKRTIKLYESISK
jgi:glycosyltransferase involved in cell wall biosynthesis